MIVGAILSVGLFGLKNQPKTLSLSFGAHPAVPAIMQMSLNGRVIVEQSQKGINESRPIEYLDGQGDVLDFKVAWYDIFDERGYEADFQLNAYDLSLIGQSGHVALRIIVGPGADLTATTTNEKAAALIRERHGFELPSVANEPDIVLAQLCADRVRIADPLLVALKRSVDQLKDTRQRSYNDLSRQSYLEEYGVLIPRCPADRLEPL